MRTSGPGRSRLRAAALLAATIALGAALRFYELGREPLWLDEATTAAFAARPLSGCVFAEIHHPPLYNTMIHVVIRIFGNVAPPEARPCASTRHPTPSCGCHPPFSACWRSSGCGSSRGASSPPTRGWLRSRRL